MGESFDHRPPGWIRQSRKRCAQFIHNHMVVDFLLMSSVDFAIPDFCSLIPSWLATTIATSAKWPRHSSTLIGNGRSAFRKYSIPLTIEEIWGQIWGHPR